MQVLIFMGHILEFGSDKIGDPFGCNDVSYVLYMTDLIYSLCPKLEQQLTSCRLDPE